MTEVVVTGGTGVLGRQVVSRLLAAGHSVRVLSRQARPTVPNGVQVVQGDLVPGKNLDRAVAGVDAIVHCATTFRKMDIEATHRLIECARKSDSPHLLYISIVGVDRIPLAYYKVKLQAESLIEQSRLPWTIVRATQFHDFVLSSLSRLARLPVIPLPKGFRFQPIDTGEVADNLVSLVAAGAANRVPDIGGPQVRTVEDLARAYLHLQERSAPLLPVPLPGGAARAFQAGANLCPKQTVGTVTWEDFLREKCRTQPTKQE